jgi:hypothetical protein
MPDVTFAATSIVTSEIGTQTEVLSEHEERARIGGGME